MDLDPKAFFDVPPRMKDDVRLYIRQVAESVVGAFAHLAVRFTVGNIQPKHVRLLACMLSGDPLTQVSREAIFTRTTRVKPIARTLIKSIDAAVATLADGDKRGGLDRKVVHFVTRALAERVVKSSSGGRIAISAVVAETCRLMLHSATFALDSEQTNTLCADFVNEHRFDTLVDGSVVDHASFRHFLASVNGAQPSARVGFD